MTRRTKRLGRILFNTLTAISLLLAIATAGLWVRSLSRLDVWYVHYIDRSSRPAKVTEFSIQTSGGGMAVGIHAYNDLDRQFSDSAGIVPSHFSYLISPVYTVGRWSRFGRQHLVPASSIESHLFVDRTYHVPIWAGLAAFFILPTIGGLVHIFAMRCCRPGHCPVCGYDTRANPAKCSECGHEIAAANL